MDYNTEEKCEAREPSVEDDISRLDGLTGSLHELMIEIRKVRQRIYEKNMRNGERNDSLNNAISSIINGEPIEERVNVVPPRNY